MTTIDSESPAANKTGAAFKASDVRFPQGDRNLRTSKVMIVDDEPANVEVARRYLSLAGYEQIVTTSEPHDAIALAYDQQPDVVLLDMVMPQVSGLDILAALRADPHWSRLPVVILTTLTDQAMKRKALDLGANDFLMKPIDPTELIPRVNNVLSLKQHHDHLTRYSRELEAEVFRRTADLIRSRQEVIHCLARAGEFRDDDTGQHVLRVGRYACLIARQLGWQGERLEILEQAAQLHDIGKIGVPDAILLKPGKLTPEEFEIMQKHSGYGRRITQNLGDHEVNTLACHTEMGARLLEASDSPVLTMAATIALSHHEKWDGSGYPLGLAGDDIPIEGRITAVADVFDALSSRRPYKPPFHLNQCMEILEEGRGKHFDPTVLDAFFHCRAEIVRVQLQHADVD
ncbi:MAG TPA: HD domain-containing phosphohydrolase [Pirellulales bacterium]|nr:HD domain-containing phosphohydrolase [Pirellulales bacterium]